ASGVVLAIHWGHDVRVAYDGPAALNVARAFHPHLILLDIGLPGMDGWQVAERLRATPETATALVLALSGFGQEQDGRHSLEAGCHGHLTKPADPGQLKEVFDRLADALPPDD